MRQYSVKDRKFPLAVLPVLMGFRDSVTLLPNISDSHSKLPQQDDPYWNIACWEKSSISFDLSIYNKIPSVPLISWIEIGFGPLIVLEGSAEYKLWLCNSVKWGADYKYKLRACMSGHPDKIPVSRAQGRVSAKTVQGTLCTVHCT